MDNKKYYIKELKNSNPLIYSVEGDIISIINFSTDSMEIDFTAIIGEDTDSCVKQWIDLGFEQATYEQVEELIYNCRYKAITDNIINLEERLLKNKKMLYELLKYRSNHLDKVIELLKTEVNKTNKNLDGTIKRM